MTEPAIPPRGSLLGIIGGLMMAENLGDVHDEIDLLCDLAGVPRPTGDASEGWTPMDWANIQHWEYARPDDDD
jgi:hypothetical protein